MYDPFDMENSENVELLPKVNILEKFYVIVFGFVQIVEFCTRV